jgi:hypothetical protein
MTVKGTVEHPTLVYLAAKFESQLAMAFVRKVLEDSGKYEVVSSWLDETDSDASAFAKSGYASRDLNDLDAAELFILDTVDTNIRGGREVEFGYALANDVPTIVVGPRRNVFHELADEKFASWTDALAYLGVERPEAIPLPEGLDRANV